MTKQKATTSTYRNQNTTNEEEGYVHNILYRDLNFMTTFNRTTSDNTDFRNLVALLDADLSIRDGNEHSFYAQFNKIENIRNVIVCYIDNEPIGCGAVKEYDPKKVEIKRMFVRPEYRGHGIGFYIL